ncbi:hypothetical protein EMWEY_00049450 [Eimeria maxima]|uniref:Uncharacterized protein n=1 Tax=Eimeria maxima TaxID=5804 RepID=U6LZ54_EIMMA|nr:hypothetical protein EMWEY_00049450 [Eimeria maxima]CDJ56128.1 hypothetical protein EMWEY_00049450 [Eimeria maxima]
MEQLQIIKKKQVGFLQALKRELLTECLIIEWMEAFFSHLRLALGPSDYLSYQHRHDLLAADLFGGPVRIETSREFLPPWVTEKLFLEGQFRVCNTPFTVPELTASRVADDDVLRVFLKVVDKTGRRRLKLREKKKIINKEKGFRFISNEEEKEEGEGGGERTKKEEKEEEKQQEDEEEQDSSSSSSGSGEEMVMAERDPEICK